MNREEIIETIRANASKHGVVWLHTTNYRETLLHASNSSSEAIRTPDYIFFTNDWFAP